MKGWKIFLIACIAFILVILLILPGIARRMAVNNSEKWFGRRIELEGLRINYFTSTVRLRDFKVYEANGQDVFTRFDTLLVDAVLWRLMKKELVVEHILLSGLRSNIIQEDSIFNFTDLVEFYSKPGTSEKKDEKPEDEKNSSPFSL